MNCKIEENIFMSYKELLKRNLITCDLCDRIFKNRFDSIIHNTSHIIIPLIKQTNLLFCNECQSVFISQDDLDIHLLRQHPEEIIIKSDIDQETDNLNINKVKKEKLDNVDTVPTVSIINRLKFEDDDVNCDDILKDLVTECKVNVQICNKWNGVVGTYANTNLENSLEGQLINLEKNRSLVPEPLTDEYACDNYAPKCNDKSKFESIHYKILINPGIYNCKHCPKLFANRFSLIQHEVVHMKLTKPKPLLCQYCDKFIAGNHYDLHRHIDKRHLNDGPNNYFVPKPCKKCGLWYRSYVRHARNYHLSEYQLNGKSYSHTKVRNVCDLCLPSLNSKCDMKYIIKGTTDLVEGSRFPCQVCGNRFFVLNIVERTKVARNKQKKMSNEVRLKIIQRRFHRLNLLSKI